MPLNSRRFGGGAHCTAAPGEGEGIGAALDRRYGGTMTTQLSGDVYENIVEQGFDGTSYVVFNPAQILRDAVGEDDPRYIFWCSQCAGSVAFQPAIIGSGRFDPAFPPDYPCFDQSVMAAEGTEGLFCQFAEAWLFSLLWAQITGAPEKSSCS